MSKNIYTGYTFCYRSKFSSFQLIGQCHVNHRSNNPIREQMVRLPEWSLTELQVLEGQYILKMEDGVIVIILTNTQILIFRYTNATPSDSLVYKVTKLSSLIYISAPFWQSECIVS